MWHVMAWILLVAAGTNKMARRGGVEEPGWTVDWEIRVRYRHTLTVCGPSDGKEVEIVFERPSARVGVGSAH